MEFKVNSKELEKLLTKIIPAVPTRTPMPILENFLFEIQDGLLTIYATDLEISLKSSLKIVSEENAKFVIPAKLLYDIVRSLKETTIHFDVGPKGKITLNTDNGVYTLSYLDPDEFPEIPSFPNPDLDDSELNELSMKGTDLKYAFEKSSFAMSKEEMRPAMMGTLFQFSEEGLRFVATDGHRLVNLLKKNISTNIDDQYIIPERAISVLVKVLDEKDVKIFLSKSHVSFVLSDIELITRIIGQKYPDYASVIPMENEFELKVKTKEIHDAIKRMMLFSPSNSRRVKFAVNENDLEISAEDLDIGASGKEKVACEYTGDVIEIGFNSAYVHDILSHLGSEQDIVFRLHSATKAVIIKPKEEKENEDLLMLLMPVRLNS
ncbi:MAG: DNA polymerase III subunit beta [Melioribacteraceae bacterium]|nr:DNA polymerase III subunit beta [Melioribacteraceae bacterium]MCF8355831.1 DNA polymerase III subunit beta [Melioribacteraceae bacterium]MCF8395276.1 DNA polymerase III subunit beta [Melioribacteraceae bacterium]MCF8420737.1 DNA polymerase III subunit beta [Melioribacteraceae bacterium]